MKSRLYNVAIAHARLVPANHNFTYRLPIFGLDLSELDQLEILWPILSYNRTGAFRINDSDYLKSIGGSLSERCYKIFEEASIPRPSRVVLLTIPRFFGYVFNPANFFIGLDEMSCCTCIIAEVHNTFGEFHIYALGPSQIKDGWFEFDKQFYVSPFFDASGCYRLQVATCGDNIKLSVELMKENQLAFSATINGTGEPLRRGAILKSIFLHPFSAWLNMPKIHLEALRLHLLKGISFKTKPPPPAHSSPGIFDRLRIACLRVLLQRGS